jgi:hypothetical protein
MINTLGARNLPEFNASAQLLYLADKKLNNPL